MCSTFSIFSARMAIRPIGLPSTLATICILLLVCLPLTLFAGIFSLNLFLPYLFAQSIGDDALGLVLCLTSCFPFLTVDQPVLSISLPSSESLSMSVSNSSDLAGSLSLFWLMLW